MRLLGVQTVITTNNLLRSIVQEMLLQLPSPIFLPGKTLPLNEVLNDVAEVSSIYNILNLVLVILDFLYLMQNLVRIRRSTRSASIIGLEERDIEGVVNAPLGRQSQSHRIWGNHLRNPEGTEHLPIQFLG